MAKGQLGTVLRQIRRLVGASAGEGLTDGHLLQRFADHHDEAAFDSLLQRHGPLVSLASVGVCWAMSMTRRTPSRRRSLCCAASRRVGPARDRRWLLVHGRVSHRPVAKADAARRRERERRAAKMPTTETGDDLNTARSAAGTR